MKIRAVVQIQREQVFDLKFFHYLCEETIEENPTLSFDELVDKSYENVLFTCIEDEGYKIISINEEDKQKVLYWIKQNVRDILDKKEK